MWPNPRGDPTLIYRAKSIEKNIEKRSILTWSTGNIDKINWETLFIKSADQK